MRWNLRLKVLSSRDPSRKRECFTLACVSTASWAQAGLSFIWKSCLDVSRTHENGWSAIYVIYFSPLIYIFYLWCDLLFEKSCQITLRKGRRGDLKLDDHPEQRGLSSGILAMLNADGNIFIGERWVYIFGAKLPKVSIDVKLYRPR